MIESIGTIYCSVTVVVGGWNGASGDGRWCSAVAIVRASRWITSCDPIEVMDTDRHDGLRLPVQYHTEHYCTIPSGGAP